MSIYKALVLFGNRDEDSSDTPFIWGSVISKNPLDDKGKSVKNPGSIMLYGAKGKSMGDCELVLVKARGIGGLYDVIPADKHETILTALELKMTDIPEIPLAESSASSTKVDRGAARDKARQVRQARQAARGARATAPVQETVAAQPE